MGSCQSTPSDSAADRSRKIERQLREDKDASKKEVKILLLGTGETGKSTVLKQMKLIHKIGFTPDEIANFRSALVLNLLSCAKELMNAMDNLEIPYGFDPTQVVSASRQFTESSLDGWSADRPSSNTSRTNSYDNESFDAPTIRRRTARFAEVASASSELFMSGGGSENRMGEVAAAAAIIRSMDPSMVLSGTTIPSKLISSIKLLWQDSGVQYCFSRAAEFQLMDSCPYLMDNIDRICCSDFTPTDPDILAARIMTTQIKEIRFKVHAHLFCVFDLGGQRSERKKWMAFFDNVKAFIYMVAISSYDQTCFEDSQTNRITESLNLFHSLTHHPALKRTCIILFLNKIDLFKEKMKVSPLVEYFPEYKGLGDYESGALYFERTFRDENQFSERDIYTHFTWATDTSNISRVLENVTMALLRAACENLGLI
ncbi:guanine nucleotide binding protein, alpha subunit [Chytriomyces cf. hyalinus JEL632]|nr:guanine nucleotide binding protein, alpha subunit [Chytriomyces cf. hyalinus JEL632]